VLGEGEEGRHSSIEIAFREQPWYLVPAWVTQLLDLLVVSSDICATVVGEWSRIVSLRVADLGGRSRT